MFVFLDTEPPIIYILYGDIVLVNHFLYCFIILLHLVSYFLFFFISLFVPYAYVSTDSTDCIQLSSLALTEFC